MTNSGNQTPNKRDARSVIIRVVTFLGGIYFFLHFLLPEKLLERVGVSAAHESISNGFIAVGLMAVGLGIINLVVSHSSRLIFRKSGWFFSLTLLCGLTVMMGTTCSHWLHERGVSERIRRVQIIGEFASRIADDALVGPGNEKSFSPHGALPPLSARVEALQRYALDSISTVQSELERAHPRDATTVALRAEAQQGVVSLREAVAKLSEDSWETMDPLRAAALREVSSSASSVGAAYALVTRAIESDSFINNLYNFLYNGLFNNLGSAMFALLGVYIAAAAYRAFRIQSFESALMMAAALVVMLGQISFGKMVYNDMPIVRQWLLEVPNSAAFRAIRLGAAVAGLLLAIRMWLSIESDEGGQG